MPRQSIGARLVPTGRGPEIRSAQVRSTEVLTNEDASSTRVQSWWQRSSGRFLRKISQPAWRISHLRKEGALDSGRRAVADPVSNTWGQEAPTDERTSCRKTPASSRLLWAALPRLPVPARRRIAGSAAQSPASAQAPRSQPSPQNQSSSQQQPSLPLPKQVTASPRNESNIIGFLPPFLTRKKLTPKDKFEIYFHQNYGPQNFILPRGGGGFLHGESAAPLSARLEGRWRRVRPMVRRAGRRGLGRSNRGAAGAIGLA